MSDVDDIPPERTGVSRRTLVRAGAHAAWVVPAVTVIGAAPAIAVSAGVHSLTWVTKTASSASGGGSGQNSPTMYTNFTISATSNPNQVASVTLSITFPSGLGAITLPASVPGGWSNTTAANQMSGGNLIAGGTATYSTSVTGTNAGADTSAWADVPFTATATGNSGHVKGKSIAVTASASGYTGPGPATVTVT